MSFKRKLVYPLFQLLFNFLSDTQKIQVIYALVGIIQETVRVDEDSSNENKDELVQPYPLDLQLFEKLYDRHTGGWRTPSPSTKIKMFDKQFYPTINYDSVELEVGHFYYAFVQLTQPKFILETGVSRGYSTSCIASALRQIGNEGHIFAIDPAVFPHLWEDTLLEAYITWIPKRSQDTLHEVSKREYDLLVIDSNHDYATCIWEVINFEKLLKVGGYILMHDSLYFDGVGAVVKQLSSNPRFEVITNETPRTHGNPRSRCPGLTIVHKIAEGKPEIVYENQYSGWYIGDASKIPFLDRIRGS